MILISVLQAGQLLVDSSKTLKQDPKSKEGRKGILEACKGILKGTQKLLDVYDDSEVRRIVQLCRTSKSLINNLRPLKEVNELVAHIRNTCSALVQLTQQANQRIDELLFPQLQARLREAMNNIVGSSNLIVSSSKAVAQVRIFCYSENFDISGSKERSGVSSARIVLRSSHT
jgi:hypothetical protein